MKFNENLLEIDYINKESSAQIEKEIPSREKSENFDWTAFCEKENAFFNNEEDFLNFLSISKETLPNLVDF